MAYSIAQMAPTSFFADYGCHVRILEEVRALAGRGHSSTIFTYPNGGTPAGADVIRSPRLPWQRGVHIGSHRNKFLLDPLLLFTTLAKGLPRHFDIVHAHLHEGALIGKFFAAAKRIPLVFDFQGSLLAEMLDHGFLSPGSPLEAAVSLLERGINRLPARIITSSSHARNLLTAGAGMAEEMVVTVTDCVDVQTFRPRPEACANPEELARLKANLGVRENHLVIGYLGLLAGYQGIPHLLQAAARVLQAFPSCHFVIMGYPGVSMYRAVADGLGLTRNVTFTGRIPYEDAPRYLSIVDVAVSPKLSETEGNGKLLNYMACGLPTVAFDGPVARELLGVDGRYARRGDPDSLAEELLALLANPAIRTALGANLRRRAVEKFSWAEGAAQIEAVYDELAG